MDNQVVADSRVLGAQMAVAAALGVKVVALRGTSRGAPRAAFARHAAMYVCRTVLGMRQCDVARAFSRRSTTVKYAVERIAEARADPELDRTLAWLETSLKEDGHV